MTPKNISRLSLTVLYLAFLVAADWNAVGQEAPQQPFLHYTTWSPIEDHIVSSNTTSYGSISLLTQAVESLPAMEEIYDVVYSPDGKHLAVANGNQLTLLDATTGSIISQAPAHATAIITISWSPDGTQLATSSYSQEDQEIKIWNVEPLESVLALRSGSVWQLAWNPTANQIASVNIYSPGFFLLDVEKSIESQQQESIYIGRDSYEEPRSGPVAWNDTGTIVAVALNDGMVGLFDVISGSEQTLMSGHDDSMTSLDFSPDGTLLASASNDGTVHVYDLTSHQLVAQYYKGETVVPRRIEFSPFGGRLAFGSETPSESLSPGELYVEPLNTVVVVPVASIEQLQRVAANCISERTAATLQGLGVDSLTTQSLSQFTASVKALSDESLPPSCRGDLLAIAEKLENLP